MKALSLGQGDLNRPELQQCIRAAAVSWRFPVAAGDYGAEVPITVVRVGGAP